MTTFNRLDISPTRGEDFFGASLPSSPTRMRYPQIRPLWWDEIHRNLNQLAEINKTRSLSNKEIHLIKKTSIQMQNQDPITQLSFLKLLSEFVFIGVNEIFYPFLNSMQEKYPEIQSYFTVKPKIQETVFTPLGIQLILGKVCPMIPTSVISSFDLPPLIESIMDHMPEGYMQGWVTYDPSWPEHFIPVFAHKENGITNIFIFDSIGHEVYLYETSIEALNSLIDHFITKTDRYKEFAIYSYKHPRLYGVAGCSAMAINDLKHLAERYLSGENLMDFYKTQAEENKPQSISRIIGPDLDMPVYELNILPPDMQKVTQSIAKILDYDDHPPINCQDPIVFRHTSDWSLIIKKQDLEEFRNSIDKSKRYLENGRLRNLYLEQKRLQYVIELLSYHFKFLASEPNSLKVERVKRKIEITPEDENLAKKAKS